MNKHRWFVVPRHKSIFPIQDTQKISVGISETRANPNVRQDVRVVTELDKKQQLDAFSCFVWYISSFSTEVGWWSPMTSIFFSRSQPGSFSSGCRRCHRRIRGLAFWSLRKPRRVRMRSVGNCGMSSLKRGQSMEIRIRRNVMPSSTTFARESARSWWPQMWPSEA